MIFGSDNLSGASPVVLKGINDAYASQNESAYGEDSYTAAAVDAFKRVFDTDLSAYFVISGTAANTLALSTMVKPWDGVVCHHQAHILLDESSGPALVTGGASLLPVPSKELKITPSALTTMLERLPNEPPHNIRARALSLSQANEGGQVYIVEEVKALCAVAKNNGMSVHMDGARFANAVASLDCHPADVTWKAGVDVLCLGATKNGAVAAEAIIFFNQALAEDFEYRLKRTGHLVSKSRLFGAQFLAWIEDDHWLELARNANTMADTLRGRIAEMSGVRLAFDTQSNETFVILQKHLFDQLIEKGASMYEWYIDALPCDSVLAEGEVLARMVTSYATTTGHIDSFVDACNSLAVKAWLK